LVGSSADIVEIKKELQSTALLKDNPVVQRLIEVGVADPGVLHELHRTPLAEIDAVCGYVAAQPNCYNPPGLVVSLVRTGIGAALLRKVCVPADRQRSARNRLARPQIAHGSIAPKDTMREPWHETQNKPEYVELWTVAQTLLAERIPATEFAVWLQETRLVAHRNGHVVVGVPNVFARDKLDIMYRSDIVDVLEMITGSRLAIEVVIDD